jgi:tetratricopeptide (TPR) repeat protein
MGNQVLAFLDEGNLDAAKQWLGWARERLKRGDGDDPLGGPLLPRFWGEDDSSNAKPDAQKMRVAAYALIATSDSAPAHLSDIGTTCDAAFPGQKQDCDLLRMASVFSARDWKGVAQLAKPMLEQHPRSQAALFYAASAAGQLKAEASLKQIGDTVLALKPNDLETLRLLAQAEAAGYQYAQAKAYLKKLQDEGKAEASDYNSLAWLSLFDGPVDDDAVHAAQQANLLTKSENFSILHTLACLYAATGKSEQARQTLMQGMEADSMEEPNSAAWYAFGSIYEQYGLKDAAIAAYRRVDPPEEELSRSEDTYLLAQKRITSLTASKPTEIIARNQ